MLGEALGDLPDQQACLVDFARALTVRPWTVGPDDVRRLAATGLSRPAIANVVGLVAMFNYLTRAADGTGIEADYGSVLPEFVYRNGTEPAPRPGPAEWPPVERPMELLALLPDAPAAWDRWREYLFDGPLALPPATRLRLAEIAAAAACDRALAAPDGAGVDFADPLERFADTLSRAPWAVGQADVDALRATGLDDLAVLHAVAVVGFQSAESRLRIGLAALARAGD